MLARELNLGGSERQLCEMARALDSDRFDAHVGCFRLGGLRARELEASGIPLAQFPVRSLCSPSNVWSSVQALRRYIRQHEIRLVHAFDAPTCLFVAMAAPFLGRAFVLTSQRNSRTVRPPAARIGLKVSDRLTDGIVVNCEALRQHLASDEGVPLRQIHLCYNGLNTKRFQRTPMTGRSDVVPPGAVIIGTVCVFRPEKRLDTLLAAFAACLALDPNLFLLLVGDGPQRTNLQQLASELGITSRCLFQAATADVVPYLNLIDIFVLPSLSEGLPNALMEAMACECACVASRVGGSPELVQHGETGLLFETGDVGGLIEHLQTLIADAPLRTRLGRRAAAFIDANFSLGVAAARLGAIYEGVMSGRKPAQ
jgi:glycosyltransferase involved in cell wall biosynthesis